MGFFDLFRKKEERKLESISLVNLSDFLIRKKQNFNNKEKEIIYGIKNLVFTFSKDLRKVLPSLDKISLEDKKAEEKIKKVCREGLEIFKERLKELIITIEKLDSKNLEVLVNGINFSLSDFEKKSFMGFEKATLLIGKELGDIKELIKSFYKDFTNILKSNEDLLKEFNEINAIERVLEKIKTSEESIMLLNKSHDDLDKKKKQEEGKIKVMRSKINEILKSEDYKKERKKEEFLETKKRELKNLFLEFLGLIDFKELAKVHHSSEKSMELIRTYREDFIASFEKDGGKFFLENIKDNSKIVNVINKIEKLKEEILNIKIKKDEIPEIERIISDSERKILDIAKDRLRFEKKSSQNEEELSLLKKEIKEKLNKISVNLED
jgi:hypothetical protein